jgi:hypothetical protein
MKLLIRMVGTLALAAFAATWVAACLTGLSLLAGFGWALLIAAALVWLRFIWLLSAAVCVGAIVAWHWPVVLAVLLAIPRVFLMLPGVASTYLASWRHPRIRWPYGSV